MVENLEQLPLWMRAALLLGVPSVIALFLVYAVTMGLSTRLSGIEATQARLERLIRATCVAAAATAEQRAPCFAP
jgi:hypothetical protein